MRLQWKTVRGDTSKAIAGILGSKIIADGFALLSGIVVARHLGPEGKGILTALIVVPTFITAFGHLGLPVSNIYLMAKKRDKQTLLVNSFYFFLLGSAVYVAGAFVLMPLLQTTFFSGVESKGLICLALLMIPLLLAKHFLVSFMRGLEKYKEYNVANILQRILRLGVMLLLVFLFNLTVPLAIVAMLISLVVSNAYSYMIIKKKIPIGSWKGSTNQFKESISYGLKEYLGNVFFTLNVKIDLLVLAAFMDRASLGIYSVTTGIAGVFLLIPTSMVVVLLPKISKCTGGHIDTILRKSIVYNTILLLTGWLAFLIVGRPLISFLYGQEFNEAYPLSVIVLLGAMLLSLRQIISRYFSGVGRPEIKSLIAGINIPVKAVSLYLLLKWYGLYGAAWSFVISSGVLLLLTIYFYFRIRKQQIGPPLLDEARPSQRTD